MNTRKISLGVWQDGYHEQGCYLISGATHAADSHTMVTVLACTRVLHEVGKVPVILFLLTLNMLSCITARKLSV